jgi:hypothetical protein
MRFKAKALWILNALRLPLCVLSAMFCLCLVFLALVFFAVRTTVLNEKTYQDFLETPSIQKKIDALVVQSTGIWQIRDYDESVYRTVFHLMKTELINPFINDLPAQTVYYLADKTNTFDPVLNLHETRGKIKWVLDQAIQQKIPFFLVETIQSNLDKIFARHVPFSMRLLPLIGVTPKMEEDMRAYAARFQHYSRYRVLIYLSPLVPLALWFAFMRKRRLFPENLAAFLGGFTLCLAFPIVLFGRQLMEIALTAINLRGRAGEEYSAFINAALPSFFQTLTTAFFILASICFCTLICILCRRWYKKRTAL